MDTAIARKALEKHLARLRPASNFRPPAKGWTRAIRDALGMTAAQLAARMKISQPSVTALERDEARRTITLARLERAADALDCTLVYAFVPKIMSARPLDEIVRKRARARATKMLTRVNKTMALEAQNLSADELDEERDELVAELLRDDIRRLWDEK